ncbi:uncharacterized protein N7483_010832 [Penicillium malachiteum]|uniref:uncharacterized protein n=1 Tax=Penicillium malachiteum TaxID=1324776 RepID=UPI002547496C|nr:uncharacterized protein N7483_010832 [Penicillium malachiteum]KAJ5713651.1 hypothetical protein N7483_010832 [Penicillium malachiteum]
MAPTKDKTPPSKTDNKVVKTQASMRSGRNRKFGNVMSDDNFRFMWTCLEGVQVDYRTVAGKLGISYSAANQRYYNLRDYFKHLAELEGRPQPATVQPSGRPKGAKKVTKKGSKKNTKGKGKGKAPAKSDDDDTSIDLTQDDDHVDLTRDDDDMSDMDENMSDASSSKGELYALIKKEIEEADKDQTIFPKTEDAQAEPAEDAQPTEEAGPAEKAGPIEKAAPVEEAAQTEDAAKAGPIEKAAPVEEAAQTEDAAKAEEAEAEQRDEDSLPDYEDAKDVQDEEDVDVA